MLFGETINQLLGRRDVDYELINNMISQNRSILLLMHTCSERLTLHLLV